MAVWALNVNITDPLVVTAGSAMLESAPWKFREVWRMSGTLFSEVRAHAASTNFGIFLLIPKITDQTDILDRLLDHQDRRSNRQHRAGRRAEFRELGKAFGGKTTET